MYMNYPLWGNYFAAAQERTRQNNKLTVDHRHLVHLVKSKGIHGKRSRDVKGLWIYNSYIH